MRLECAFTQFPAGEEEEAAVVKEAPQWSGGDAGRALACWKCGQGGAEVEEWPRAGRRPKDGR